MYLINLILSSAVFTFFYLYIASKLSNKTIDFKNKTTIICIILILIVMPPIFLLFNNFMRTILNYIVLVIASTFIFNESYHKALIIAFIVFIYYFFAEIIFSLILMIGFGIDSNVLATNWNGHFSANLIIGGMAFILSEIKLLSKPLSGLLNIRTNHHYIETIVIIVLGISIFANKNGTFLGLDTKYIVNLLLIIIFLIIIFYLFKEKEYSSQLLERYDQLFKYIGKYEKELTKKSLCIHDYSNQIIAIKGFVNKKDKELNQYLDEIVRDLKNSESKALNNMDNLPKGGLKGLIYYKLGDLNEEGVKVLLDISATTKKSPFSKISANLYKDILTIIGVYLDNAIEAAKSSDKKEIILEIYYDKGIFTLILTNTYKGNLRLDMFDKAGYSTKGQGRGYGLYLSNSIVTKYECISQKRELSEEYYTQYLFVNFKNIPKK